MNTYKFTLQLKKIEWMKSLPKIQVQCLITSLIPIIKSSIIQKIIQELYRFTLYRWYYILINILKYMNSILNI